MKKIFIVSIVLITIGLCFFFFEPILTHTSGWNTFPKMEITQPALKHKDSISKKADSILKDAFTHLKTPALSVAIGMNGAIIWSNAIGYQHIENDTKVSLTTKFRIGSTSKAVTAMGVGVLLQEKKLHLTSTVKEFVPYANEELSEITLKQLASHTSGIRNYKICFCFPLWEYYNNDEYTTVEESVGIFNKDPLLFAPGTGFSYSSYNYTMLSAMIEGVSETDFPDFMRSAVFNPLGLDDIHVEKEGLEIKDVATFYRIEADQYKEVFKVNNSNKWAGGGFIATPTDLAKLGNALLMNTLFNEETKKTLTQPTRLNNGEVNEQNYAIGWRHDIKDTQFGDQRKIQILHHAGVAAGSTSVLILFPEYNISISLLMNRSGSASELFKLAHAFAKLFIQEVSVNLSST